MRDDVDFLVELGTHIALILAAHFAMFQADKWGVVGGNASEEFVMKSAEGIFRIALYGCKVNGVHDSLICYEFQ